MAMLKVTLIKSTVGATPHQKKVVEALGVSVAAVAQLAGEG